LKESLLSELKAESKLAKKSLEESPGVVVKGSSSATVVMVASGRLRETMGAQRVVVGHVGNSHAVLVQGPKAWGCLTDSHLAADHNEAERLSSCPGAQAGNPSAGENVDPTPTRAFGAGSSHPTLISEPSLHDAEFCASEAAYVILGSESIWRSRGLLEIVASYSPNTNPDVKPNPTWRKPASKECLSELLVRCLQKGMTLTETANCLLVASMGGVSEPRGTVVVIQLSEGEEPSMSLPAEIPQVRSPKHVFLFFCTGVLSTELMS